MSHPNTTTNTTTNTRETFIERTIAVGIWKYCSPILIILGTIGNILLIIVLCRGQFRRSTTTIYFIAMAICDLLVLYSGLLRWWIFYQFDLDLRHLHPVVCKLHTPLVTFSLQCSAWILVAVTIERYLSVASPHTIKHRCTRRTTMVIIVVIIIILAALNFHFVFGLGDYVLTTSANQTFTYHCKGVADEYYKFTAEIWPWIDLTFYCLLPFAILTIFNILILYKVIQCHRQMRPSVYSLRHAKPTSKTSSMVVTLLLINLVYFLCTTPISAFLVVHIFLPEELGTRLAAVRSLVFAVVNQFQYINNVCNFVLYCLSGSRFRAELLSLFRRKGPAIVNTASMTRQSTLTNGNSVSVIQRTSATSTT